AKETQDYERNQWKIREEYSEKIARDNGCKVIELSEQEYKEFQNAMEPVYKKHGGPYMDIINAIRNTN
ncbi:MAG: TRAP transporter substrate-binding protein, partial [Treponema sp.]|nr:TRAP transporter substrate-binding protein [Treponema sp.]